MMVKVKLQQLPAWGKEEREENLFMWTHASTTAKCISEKDVHFGKAGHTEAIVGWNKTAELWPAISCNWQPQLPHSQQSMVHWAAAVAKWPWKNRRSKFWADSQPLLLSARQWHRRSWHLMGWAPGLGACTWQQGEGSRALLWESPRLEMTACPKYYQYHFSCSSLIYCGFFIQHLSKPSTGSTRGCMMVFIY